MIKVSKLSKNLVSEKFLIIFHLLLKKVSL